MTETNESNDARFQIRLSKEDRNKLKAAAALQGVTMEALIRDAALGAIQPGKTQAPTAGPLTSEQLELISRGGKAYVLLDAAWPAPAVAETPKPVTADDLFASVGLSTAKKEPTK